MKNKYIYLLGIILIFLSSCSKSEIDTFASASDNEMVNILGEEAEVSFDLIPETEVTYDITARLSGFAVGQARTINIVATSETTGVEGVHFTISDCVIPANEIEGTCQLTLMADTTLVDGDSLIIELEVQKSGELLPGIDTKLRYKIVAGLPNAWPDWLWGYFFGSYSKEKYKFLIGLFGSADEVAKIPSWGNFMNMGAYQFYINKELKKYNDAHGTLIDENGDEVTFPGGF